MLAMRAATLDEACLLLSLLLMALRVFVLDQVRVYHGSEERLYAACHAVASGRCEASPHPVPAHRTPDALASQVSRGGWRVLDRQLNMLQLFNAVAPWFVISYRQKRIMLNVEWMR